MDDPLAYLITFTCYGTWLHGDRRGSVDRKHNAFESSLLPASENRVAFDVNGLDSCPLILTSRMREVVAATIREVCKYRNWTLHEQNVRSNHVHVVVTGNVDPDKIMKDLKAYATRRLREAGEIEKDSKLWTEGGSTKYLWNQDSLDRAVEYVKNQ